MFRACCRPLVPIGLVLSIAATVVQSQTPRCVRRVDIVHTTHTDIGFTDHPLVCREQQKRYLDIALDTVLGDPQFCWTAETTLAVTDWWCDAPPERRQDLLRAIETGRLEIAALALNQTPTLAARQWQTMLEWLPEDVWQKAQPRVGMQNDVNGFPRAGALALLDRAVPYLFMGINATNGGPPFQTPRAFWWKMPDGRRIFVWLGEHYAAGFYYFHPTTWRRGPVPESTDTRYRPARPGDFFLPDETAVRAAHAHLLGRLAKLEAAGYDYPSLILSVTNEWRIDNDPPFPALARFVETWNRLQLQPELRLSPAAQALDRLRAQVGDRLPEYAGEWTDWWVNGCASGPREVAASRKAKRLLAAALSPVWGPADCPAIERSANAILRDLCVFDEHTWGSADSIALPHEIDTWAQYNEKSRTAFKPLAMSKLLLSQRARTALDPKAPPGLHVANTAPAPFTGWVTMPSTCLRGNWHSLVEKRTGRTIPVEYRAGYAQFGQAVSPEQFSPQCDSETFPDHVAGQLVRFWVEGLPPQSVTHFIPAEETVSPAKSAAHAPQLKLDDQGWPVEAIWPGMAKPLFAGPMGDFACVQLQGFSARWKFGSVLMSGDQAQRAAAIEQTAAQPAGPTTVEQTAHSIVFEQQTTHARLKWLIRRLELYRDQPRAQLTVRFYRISSELPEVFFIGCELPADRLPIASCGGVPFTPFADQLPGTCRDYFAVDGWLDYAQDDGHRLWVTRDAPLVALGGPQTLRHLQTAPERPGRAYAMVFDNTWLTNFLADSHGQFEFRFDLLHLPAAEAKDSGSVAAAAESLCSEPVVLFQSKLPVEEVFLRRLSRP